MNIPTLKTAVREAGQTVHLELSGRLDFATSPNFRTAFGVCLRSSAVQEVLVDMAALDYIDSHGLALLLVAERQAREQGKSLVVTHCSRDVMKVFRLVSFDKLLTIR